MGEVGKAADRKFARFADFYPFYLSQHANRVCRRLHFAGTTLGLLAVLHAFSEKNRDMLVGRIPF